jgi:hypothetical protein
MKDTDDKTLANWMLQTHKDGGYRFIPFVRMNASAYMIIIIALGVIFGSSAYTGHWKAFVLLACYFIGGLSRDVLWFSGLNKSWPFEDKVINWDAVQKIADENETVA